MTENAMLKKTKVALFLSLAPSGTIYVDFTINLAVERLLTLEYWSFRILFLLESCFALAGGLTNMESKK